ncbi:hypothetical protein AXG93_4134s1010 [Marchantia polymorpha subsp. ruderalis]|uniref:Uncharacterized protein n=1 Tax=Marchantia polymorpha subsp. ruderalis TaxID=1480154 RepID=A0A176VEL7_MARPO|nr:hypothetical protein AXG93_4134s1010 [Marchantia polymorpha subsp. ruderalis]
MLHRHRQQVESPKTKTIDHNSHRVVATSPDHQSGAAASGVAWHGMCDSQSVDGALEPCQPLSRVLHSARANSPRLQGPRLSPDRWISTSILCVKAITKLSVVKVPTAVETKLSLVLSFSYSVSRFLLIQLKIRESRLTKVLNGPGEFAFGDVLVVVVLPPMEMGLLHLVNLTKETGQWGQVVIEEESWTWEAMEMSMEEEARFGAGGVGDGATVLGGERGDGLGGFSDGGEIGD